MGWWRSIAVLAALIVAGLVPPRGLAQTMVTLNSGAVAPQGVALDSAGNVYFTDSKLGRNKVRRTASFMEGGSAPAGVELAMTALECCRN